MRAVVLLSGCRAPRPDGCRRRSASLALVLASLVSIPFCFFSEKKKKKNPVSVLRPPPLFFRAHSPQSFPVALELRRVGVGHRWRITVDADAAELQGPWSALEPRPRLSSLFLFRA